MKRELDEWLRHRLRAVQLKQWRRGTTMYRELRALGATPEHAARIAGNSRRWWRNSRYELNRIMPIGYSISLACRASHDLNFSNRPVRTRMPGGVGGARSVMIAPYPDSTQELIADDLRIIVRRSSALQRTSHNPVRRNAVAPPTARGELW